MYDNILDSINNSIRPEKEIFFIDDFASWRFSYGVFNSDKKIYFIYFYPAFCTKPKATYHYSEKEEFLGDLDGLIRLCESTPIPRSTIVACAFALSRNKESIELFSEQKYLMDLGLRHFVLDNYYQDQIKSLCDDYYTKGTLVGKTINFGFICDKTCCEEGMCQN